MNLLPDIWGKGALFGYSALEGENKFYSAINGQLMAEHIGMTFDGGQSELYLRLKGIPWILEIEFSIVASDVIEGKLGSKDMKFLALDQRTIVGYAPKEFCTPIYRADLSEEKKFDGAVAYMVPDQLGDHWYAFATKEESESIRFAVARDDIAENAAEAAVKAISADIDGEAIKRIAFFDKVPTLKSATDIEQKTLSKCYSVMKSQFYSPEGVFKGLWTTPDRIPHRKWWLWDTVFHSIGNIFLSPELAWETMRSILDVQKPDGFIPHMSWPDKYVIPHVQPPLVAWGTWCLYERTGNKEWAEELYHGNKPFLNYIFKNRDSNNNYLFEWYISAESVDCRCGESGMDNSPRFDDVVHMDAIDFSCFMANEMRYMAKLGELLGYDDEAAEYSELYKKISGAINEFLYDEKDGRYYDFDIDSGEFHKVTTPSGFLPLFAEVCSPERAKKLAEDITDPETFWCDMPLPTVAFNDKYHSKDYWRGTTWICYNYMVQQGLRNYGYEDIANEIVDRTIRCMAEWYEREGCIFEVYDPRNRLCPTELDRKGPSLKPTEPFARLLIVRDFGWSSTLYTAMIMDREKRNTP